MAGYVQVFTGKTAAVAAPTAATDGVPLRLGSSGFLASSDDQGFGEDTDEVLLEIYSTAGSGTPMEVAAPIRQWGWNPSLAAWFPLGTGAGATKGQVNDGLKLEETESDKIRHAERVFIGGFTRYALSTGAFTGTITLAARLSALPGKVRP